MRGAAGGVGASGRAGRDGTLKRPMRIYMALWALGAAVAVSGASPPATRAGGRAARVVSFSPGITRILFDMGLGGQVVGVTRFCRLDPGVRRPRVGDAFHISTEAILAVRPDVIFAQTSPEKFQGVRAARPDVTVVELRLEELADVPAAIRRIGEVLGRGDLAAPCGAAFRAKLEIVRRRGAGGRRPRVLFVMGTDRPTVAGAGNFIGDLIEAAGGVNAGADIPGVTRWRRTHIDAIARARPDVLICQTSAKGAEADAREYWLQWKDLPAAAAGRVVVVNEPEWSIPGTHLADLGLRLKTLILAGIEAHVCILQTALEALDRGMVVHVLADAVTSRADWMAKNALSRLAQAGAVVSNTESAMFEYVGDSADPLFKRMLFLVK